MLINIKEELNVSTLQNASRSTGNTPTSMRRYQQLALAILTAVSLTAFLFYKHEYDRLRLTLEYLDTFGSNTKEEFFQSSCPLNIHSKLTTAPAWWTKVSSDLAVYSTFWDEGNGIPNPILRTFALVKKSGKSQSELSSFIFYENSSKNDSATCSLERVNLLHGINKIIPDHLMIVTIICQIHNSHRDVPYMIRFKAEELSPPIFIQESENWKSVPNISAVCVFTPEVQTDVRKLIEFISFHHLIGIEKFVFYGPILTPIARKLLDKYSDELGIAYEEKQFILPAGFSPSIQIQRKVIEQDCVYRHRNIYENVLVLKPNEFLIPRIKLSLIGVLSEFFPNKEKAQTITEFHLSTQHVCIDDTHTKVNDLLLGSQLHLTSLKPSEEGAMVIHPHLSTSLLSSSNKPIKNEQHIPFSVAGIISFEYCSEKQHEEVDHLPSYKKFMDLVQKSLLYRKLNSQFFNK